MREIKFRAWDKKEQCWLDPNCFYITGSGEPFTCQQGRYNITCRYELMGTERYTTERFTGLKDKNVWEDDIITFIPIDGSTKKRQTGRVYYCEKRAAFCVKSKAWNCPLSFCKDIEVIGNIHENKELLGDTK